MNAISRATKFIGSGAGRTTSVSALALVAIAITVLYFLPDSQTPKASGTAIDRLEDAAASAASDSSDTNLSLSPEKLASINLDVAPVVRATWPGTIRMTGRVELNASRIAHVSSLVEGVVREVPVRLGGTVRRGDVLAYIDSREVGEAKLNLVRGQLRLKTARRKHEWHRTISENTTALLTLIEENRSLADIETALEGKPVGKFREEIVTALVRLDRASADHERLKPLGEKSIVPGKEVLRAAAAEEIADAAYKATLEQIRYEAKRQLLDASEALHEAESAVAVARSRLFILGYHEDDIESMDPLAEGERVAYYPLRAPIDGTIIEVHAPLSQHVGPETELVEIADFSTVWLRADVFEKDLAAVHGLNDREIAFHSVGYPGRRFTAKVFSLGDVVNDETRASGLLAAAENPQRLLKPGMFVQIEMGLDGAASVLQVPIAAVQRHDDETFVFVRDGSNGFARRDVRLGRNTDQVVEIHDGVQEADLVVVEGGFALKSEMLSELMTEE